MFRVLSKLEISTMDRTQRPLSARSLPVQRPSAVARILAGVGLSGSRRRLTQTGPHVFKWGVVLVMHYVQKEHT